ncbi:baseplate assembly protein [Jeotgalibacillus terrae]|uniref:Baseplate J/gp47 family protein n=1 Tax=Jeotgalibacillus terrae TaxID=587735 RepID=A0ABW5ZEN2_9BACL|nr:baseplate J/gp47 family protein [Jeotgalibacillus terrae]MBM7579999.1 phage-related baseplate assembly protein [Jeotgalibacillus terrae]
MSRFNLPEINFVELDAAELERLGVTKFEELMGETLSESDPRRKMLQSVAFVGAMLANNIDFTAKQNRLTYAVDNYLEHIGAGKNVDRLAPVAAKTMVRYNVNNPEEFTIPAGHRLSINDLYFETQVATIVEIGVEYVDIQSVCSEPGTAGNDFLPGQITEIVDPLPWVSSAVNVTTSSGGTDWETDDAYAERIRTANENLSTAGPELGYEYLAKSASQNVIDVHVDSPAAVEIVITPLMINGEAPDEDEKTAILAACNARSARPMTDLVSVADPVITNHTINVTYYLPQSLVAQEAIYQTAVGYSVDDYVLWQKSKLGRGIDPSELYARMTQEGAKRISVDPNTYVSVADNEVAHVAVNLTYGGLIND